MAQGADANGSDAKDPEEFWLFGYGSLIWKPPPHFDLRIPGYVEGYVRRFWQASQDHRGTPEAPGRVVTLIERSFWETLGDNYTIPEQHVWGAAYRIQSSKVAEVKEYLDIREINGYSIQFTPFHASDSSIKSPISCLVYIGLPDNPQFMGVQEPQALAEHILHSSGPSGENVEYLLMLETALESLNEDSSDSHITDLANRIRGLQAKPDTQLTSDAVGHELERIASGSITVKQEETEPENTKHHGSLAREPAG